MAYYQRLPGKPVVTKDMVNVRLRIDQVSDRAALFCKLPHFQKS